MVVQLRADERETRGLWEKYQALCGVGEAGCLRGLYKGGKVTREVLPE